ncbi:MAG: hypothetical protein QM820_59750 [Minicystis sp.]
MPATGATVPFSGSTARILPASCVPVVVAGSATYSFLPSDERAMPNGAMKGRPSATTAGVPPLAGTLKTPEPFGPMPVK